MYKKLSTNPLFIFTFMISALFTIFFCGRIELDILTDVSSVFDMICNFNNFSFFFSVEDLIDTEIVARRIGSGLATAGLGGVGTGIGLVFSGLIKGFSRNPSLKDDLFSYAIFGFALTEAIGLFALMMAFMLLYA